MVYGVVLYLDFCGIDTFGICHLEMERYICWYDNRKCIAAFLSYEGYIAIQFTKVAGIIGSVAIFTLASEKEHSRSSRIVAAGLWIVACMIRHDCAKMVLGAWCVVLFAEFVLLVWREKKICWKPSVKNGDGCFVLCVSMCWCPNFQISECLQKKEIIGVYTGRIMM